jgi:hypothetical protein
MSATPILKHTAEEYLDLEEVSLEKMNFIKERFLQWQELQSHTIKLWPIV